MAELLSLALLEQLEWRWRSQRVPIVDNLRPGLSDDEMDAITVPLGVRLAAEPRVWWGWHDGVPASARGAERLIGPGTLSFLPLAAAAELYRYGREAPLNPPEWLAARQPPLTEDDRDRIWPPGRFPITEHDHGDTIACDCEVPAHAASPVFCLYREDGVWPARPSAVSFAQMVTWWIEAIDRGVARYVPEQQRWRHDYNARTDEMHRSRLV